jgi:hypothetical protein
MTDHTDIRKTIRQCIGDWWNDYLRKYWRISLEDPSERSKYFDDLADYLYEMVFLRHCRKE